MGMKIINDLAIAPAHSTCESYSELTQAIRSGVASPFANEGILSVILVGFLRLKCESGSMLLINSWLNPITNLRLPPLACYTTRSYCRMSDVHGKLKRMSFPGEIDLHRSPRQLSSATET